MGILKLKTLFGLEINSPFFCLAGPPRDSDSANDALLLCPPFTSPLSVLQLYSPLYGHSFNAFLSLALRPEWNGIASGSMGVHDLGSSVRTVSVCDLKSGHLSSFLEGAGRQVPEVSASADMILP